MYQPASVRAGGAYRKEVPLMALEILYVLAAVATIGGFVLDVADRLLRLWKRRNARRMAREEDAG